MASGFSMGFGGGTGIASILSYSSSTLGDFIREAQLDDFLYSFGGPARITSSRELPGSTHWDPQPAVPVEARASGGEPGVVEAVINAARGSIPGVVLGRDPDFVNTGQPPIIFAPAPIILPGQVDPGREELENEGEDVAHTWTHVGSQLLGAIFPDTVAAQSFVAGPGQVQLGPFDPGVAAAVPAVTTPMYSGTCPPRKTRTLTIDCATGQEIKRTRRRRKKLVTNGDMGILFQIANLPNTKNVAAALSAAVRR